MFITAACILFLTIDWLNEAVPGRFFTFLRENLLTPNTFSRTQNAPFYSILSHPFLSTLSLVLS